MKRNSKTSLRKSPPVTRRRKNSGGGTTNSSNRRSESPEDHCAICLGAHQNSCQPDNCFHRFCFDCLKEWSKRKAECPLCKKTFQAIFHTIVADDDYKIYDVPVPPAVPIRLPGYFDFMPVINDFFGTQRRFFHYPSYTHSSRHRHGHYGVNYDPAARPSAVAGSDEGLMYSNLPAPQEWAPSAAASTRSSRYSLEDVRARLAAAVVASSNLDETDPRRRFYQRHPPQYPDEHQLNAMRLWDPLEYRRTVYRYNLRPRPRETGVRSRIVSAAFFLANEAQLHRLGPFVDRELRALVPHLSSTQHGHVVTHIFQLLARYEVLSSQFRAIMSIYMGSTRANQFCDELHSFARSPHELNRYDESVVYERRTYDSPHLVRLAEDIDRNDLQRAYEIMRCSSGTGVAGGSSHAHDSSGSESGSLDNHVTTHFRNSLLPPNSVPFSSHTRFYLPQQLESTTSSSVRELALVAAGTAAELNPETDFNFMTGGVDGTTNLPPLENGMLDFNVNASWRGAPLPERPHERPRTPMSLSRLLSDSPLRNPPTHACMPGNDPGAGPSWANFVDDRQPRLLRHSEWYQPRSLTPVPATVPSPDSDLDSLFSFINRATGSDNCVSPPTDILRAESVTQPPHISSSSSSTVEQRSATAAAAARFPSLSSEPAKSRSDEDEDDDDESESVSDCLITGYEKPYEARTPIPISSDDMSSDERHIKVDLEAMEESRRLSTDSLTEPSIDEEQQPPRRKVQWLPFKKRRPTEIIEVSSDSDEGGLAASHTLSLICAPSKDTSRESEEDDVVITRYSPAASESNRHRHFKRRKKKDRREKRDKSSKRHRSGHDESQGGTDTVSKDFWQIATSSCEKPSNSDCSARPTCSYKQRSPFLTSIMPLRMRITNRARQRSLTPPSSPNVESVIPDVLQVHEKSPSRCLDIVTTSDAEEANGPDGCFRMRHSIRSPSPPSWSQTNARSFLHDGEQQSPKSDESVENADEGFVSSRPRTPPLMSFSDATISLTDGDASTHQLQEDFAPVAATSALAAESSNTNDSS